MEDPIHKSGPIERWRFVEWRCVGTEECAEADRAQSDLSLVSAGLRRALDILLSFPEALQAVQAGLRELAEAPS